MEEIEAKCTQFLNDFKQKANKTDQLPVQMAGYDLLRSELIGEIVEWCHQYLSEKQCPPPLLPHFIRRTVERMEQLLLVDPPGCGFDEAAKVYRPLRLMQKTISVLIDVCLELLENDKMLDMLKAVSTEIKHPRHAVTALKNTRKKMEDRHICINDFNKLFSLDDEEPTSFYAIFDGHGGSHAASYSVAHFHHFLATNAKYPKKIDEALRDTFVYVDRCYAEKSVQQSLSSGTTALSALYRQKERKLYVGWLGDSQALLVKQGRLWQIVRRHSPDTKEERTRIEQLGGMVIKFAGTWRVNGQLAVARAIGPQSYKPFISNEPDICCVELDGDEDFLVMASDGLWDHLTEDDIAINVYKQVQRDPENLNLITHNLVHAAKENGSSDNITAVVVFLKDPKEIVQPPCMNGVKSTEEDPSRVQSNFVEDSHHLMNSLESRILSELRNMHQPVLDASTEITETPTEPEKCDVEKACDISGNEQVVGDSGCEESEDEWDFIKPTQKPASSEEQTKGKYTVNPFSEENFASEASARVQERQQKSSGMSSEVMDSLFTAAAAQNSAGDLGDHVKDHVNGAHGMLFDDMTPTTPDDKQDDGSSSLNPTAREFVPSFSGASPTPPTSNGSNLFLFDDVVVSQSPRKPTTGMETINVPSETEFDEEISNRPHELEEPNDFIASNGHNENGNGIEEALNPKEAAQGDEKSEDDYKVETIRIEGMTPLTFTNQFDDRFNQPEAMEESFYEEKTSEELNKVQILPVAEESSEQETPEEKDQVYGLNPFEATLEEISAEVENNLIDVTQQVAFEITTLLKEAQGEVEQIMEKKETIPEEEEPIVVVKDEEPTKVVADVDNFEDFERQMNEENQKHLEKVSGELLVPESSVDLAISPVPSMSPLPEPSVESEVDFVAKEDFVANETSQPIVIEDSFVDLTKSPEPLETVVEHVEQFMVSPEPSPATVLIPETPVLESQPIVVDDEPAVIEREATPEPAVQEPVIDFESVAMDSSPVVEAVIEPEPVLIEAVKEAELPVEPLIDMVEPVVKEPTPEPVIEAPQVIAEQPQSTPEPQAIVAESPVAVAAVMEDEVKVSEAPKLIESIPDVIPKAEAAKVQEEEKKKAAAPVKKTTTTKTTAAPRPKTATTSAIAPKTATTKPAATAKSAPPTKTSPTTAAAKRAVPATTAPRSATTARPAPAKPASATMRPATAKPAPAATSRVTASRVTSATSKVSPTTEKAATGPKTTTTAKTTAAARPTTASSRPASSTLASRKPLTSTTTRTATSAKAADDKNAPAKPASTLTKSTASSAARITTTAAPRRPAQTATSAARAAKATSAGATATTKTTTATTKTSSTMKTSSTLATKKNLIKSPTSGAPASGKIAGDKPVMNGQQETVKAVENGTTNGHE